MLDIVTKFFLNLNQRFQFYMILIETVISKIEHFLSDENVKLVFDHIRNLFIAATITGAGIYEGRVAVEKTDYLTSSLSIAVVMIGFGLFLFNFAHFIVKLRETSIPKWKSFVLLPIYFLLVQLVYQAFWASKIAS